MKNFLDSITYIGILGLVISIPLAWSFGPYTLLISLVLLAIGNGGYAYLLSKDKSSRNKFLVRLLATIVLIFFLYVWFFYRY